MIYINEGKQDGFELNHKNFPHLFSYDETTNEYYQTSDFWWDFDENFDLVVETTIENIEKLKEKVEKTLEKQKKLTQEIIEKSNKKLNKINEMLGA